VGPVPDGFEFWAGVAVWQKAGKEAKKMGVEAGPTSGMH